MPGVKLNCLSRHRDARGVFYEPCNKRNFAAAGIDVEFVQDNFARSPKRGTIRGLHFQTPPHAQAKLVWVVRGAALDVVVDLRRGSPTFGKHQAFQLSADNARQIFIPAGLAHGYCTLEADTEITYKVDTFYAPGHEGGLLWNDPEIGIQWPLNLGEITVADREFPRFKDLPEIFS